MLQSCILASSSQHYYLCMQWQWTTKEKLMIHMQTHLQPSTVLNSLYIYLPVQPITFFGLMCVTSSYWFGCNQQYSYHEATRAAALLMLKSPACALLSTQMLLYWHDFKHNSLVTQLESGITMWFLINYNALTARESFTINWHTSIEHAVYVLLHVIKQP